jgi:hypothetical protein
MKPPVSKTSFGHTLTYRGAVSLSGPPNYPRDQVRNNPSARQRCKVISDHRKKLDRLIFSSGWFAVPSSSKERNAQSNDDFLVYVGSSWGEVQRSQDEHVPSYIDLRRKSAAQRVNIAIVRIKEEQDFLEYTLMKYIEVMNDLGMVEAEFYDRIKYGSSDPKIICMLKNGLSLDLAKVLLMERYEPFISFDIEKDEVFISRDALPVMRQENVNCILSFELQFHAN